MNYLLKATTTKMSLTFVLAFNLLNETVKNYNFLDRNTRVSMTKKNK